MGKIIDLALRAGQLIFGAVVLGLSISAIEWQHFGSAPATSGFAAFTGAFGMLAALLGIAAIWVSMLQGVIMMAVDALAAVVFLAGGIAMAVGLKGIGSCSKLSQGMVDNGLINGGCKGSGSTKICGFAVDAPSSTNSATNLIENRCRQMTADSAFLFLGFFASLGAGIYMYFVARRSYGKTTHSGV